MTDINFTSNSGTGFLETDHDQLVGFFETGTYSPATNTTWGTYRIVDLGDPSSAQDAATKNYVDSNFASASSTTTFTNKTIDGDNNTISNLDIGNEVDWATISDVTDRTAFASGDKLLIFEAGVGLRKIDYDDLPAGGGGGSTITSGADVPTSAPSAVGYTYIDTDQEKAYVGINTTNVFGFKRIAFADEVYSRDLLDAMLSGYIGSLLEDPTPELSGNLYGNDRSIHELQGATFFQEYDNGNSGTSATVDWTLGNKQKITLTGNCTFTFTDPVGPCSLIFKLVQDGTGSRTVTWPGDVNWAGGTAPTLTTSASAVDIVTIYFDGTNYYAGSALDFS